MSILNRISSMLGSSKYVNEDLVKKGLEKISPKLKPIFDLAGKHGYSTGAIIGFLKSQLSQSPVEEDPYATPDQLANKNLKRRTEIPEKLLKTGAQIAATAIPYGLAGQAIAGLSSPSKEEQKEESPRDSYSPSAGFFSKHPGLAKFMDDLINAGMSPEDAADRAKSSRKWAPDVADIENETGEDFTGMISRLFRKSPSSNRQQGTTGQALQELSALMKQYFASKGAR